MDKLDTVLTGLEPAMLNHLAEDGYARNRHDDLATIAAEGHPAGDDRVRRRSGRKGRWALLAGGTVAVGAAAAVAVAVALPAGQPRSPSPAPAAAPPNARTFLLASATIAARSSTAAGTYWYIKERDYEPAVARPAIHVRKSQKKALFFGATFAATEESWTGQNRARTIVNEDLVFTFASAADKARWVAAGKPPLSTAAGFGVTRTVSTDYSMTLHWGLGSYQLSLAGIRRLPVTASELGKTMRRMWVREPDKAGAVGLPHPSFAQYLVQWADVLLTGPSRAGTKAAIYQLLAQEPGVSIAAGVTDPLGRAGVAVSDGGGDYLIIQPGTAKLLAYATAPVRANSAVAATAGVSVYELSGWTSQLGVAP